MPWNNLTYFGDSMLLLPTAIILALFIAWKVSGHYTALAWLFTFGCAGFIVSLSKLLFLTWGIGSATLDFTGFSGHTTMSATLWPVMMWLIGGAFSLHKRRMMIAIGFLIPLMVGISRLALHAHSPSEVIAGVLLGSGCSSLFLHINRHQQVNRLTSPQLALLLLLPLALMNHGQKATTQQFLEHLATKISGHQPWSREKLLHPNDQRQQWQNHSEVNHTI